MTKIAPLIALLTLSLAPAVASAAESGACPSLILNATISRATADAREAFAATRLEDFQAATGSISSMLPCLMEPIEPAVAAEAHRIMGLGAFVERQGTKAEQAFAAARGIEPDFSWPEELIPWGHPLLSVYQALPLDQGRFATLPAPPAGWVYLDGRPSEPRPLDWPAILQVSDAEGAIQLTAYLWPDMPLPDYTRAVAAAPAPVVARPVPDEAPAPVLVPAASTTVRRGPKGWALATAGGAAVASGALYLLAAREASSYWDPATPTGDLPALRGRTNGLVLASAGAGALALGTGVAAFLTVQW
ncbi:MAG: hypothetical protein ABIO70_19880 [Pseudomonadota bacterium]